MTFEEYIEMGYKLFGRAAMQKFDKFTSGEINFKTCIDEAYEEYIKQKNTPTLEPTHECYGCCHYEGCGYFEFYDWSKTEEENFAEHCCGCCCGDGCECNRQNGYGCDNYEIEPILG